MLRPDFGAVVAGIAGMADLIAWVASSPPEFVLTEGIVLPIEEVLP